jgi:hypothetical protein
MISKISAIIAAAVVLASASVASAQTVYAPHANSTRIREICATGTQTTPRLTHMAGRADSHRAFGLNIDAPPYGVCIRHDKLSPRQAPNWAGAFHMPVID